MKNTYTQLLSCKAQLKAIGLNPTRFTDKQVIEIQNDITMLNKLLKNFFKEQQHMHIKNQIKYGFYALQHIVNVCMPPLYVLAQYIPALSLNKIPGAEFGPTHFTRNIGNSMACSLFTQESATAFEATNWQYGIAFLPREERNRIHRHQERNRMHRNHTYLTFTPRVDGPNSIVLMRYRSAISSKQMMGVSVGIRDNKLSMQFEVSLDSTRFNSLCYGLAIYGFELNIMNFFGSINYLRNPIAYSSNANIFAALFLGMIVFQYIQLLDLTMKQRHTDGKRYQELQEGYKTRCAVEKQACMKIVQNLYTKYPALQAVQGKESLKVARAYRPGT